MKNEEIKKELYKRGLSNNILIEYDFLIDYIIELIKKEKKW